MKRCLVRTCARAVALTSWAAGLGCAGDGTGLDQSGNPITQVTPCVVPTGDCTTGLCFDIDIQPILSDNCAFSGCHAGTQPAQGQNLSNGVAYANIVCVQANERPGMMRVRPFEPDSSYLVHKIQGTQGAVGGSGERMPLGLTPLTPSQISLIRTWITQGARN